MSSSIVPRSPRETMSGWMHLPRYVDKVRLHLAGKLPADYQKNFGGGFDAAWLKAAGVQHEDFVKMVAATITDGEVCDWVRKNVKKTEADKEALRTHILNYPRADDAAMTERLAQRKQESGLGHRDDIRCFVDYIDADEGRI